VFSGDYIAGPHGEDVEIAAMRWILSELRASHGIFATNSDSDDERQRQLILQDLPVRYLLNKSETVEVEGVRVRVGGLNHTTPRWSRMAEGSHPDELFVVACHSPDHAEETSRLIPDADLYLCGHTHGGQVQVPFFGPLATACDAPRHVAAGGVFETSTGMPLLLSRGVGMEGDYAPRFRFWCRPHVFLLTLRGEPSSPRR
jgi:predicted MPP superfamily phosphohydrolase